jgi:DNA topoisomerase-3
MDPEDAETALEKLWVHGGARYTTGDGGQLVARGDARWLQPYQRQRAHRKEQLDAMQRYADGHACRMAALVRHFGDLEDKGQPCGLCDVCDPDACLVRSARAPSPAERQAAGALVEALRARDGQATGRLHTECGGRLDRRAFEEVLGGLVRAGLLRVAADTFEKDGQTIRFQRVWLTPEARSASSGSIEFTLPEGADTLAGASPRRRKTQGGSRGGRTARPGPPAADQALTERLKQWRLAEARKAGVPAFRILHDRTLLAIAAAQPDDEDELLGVAGIGPSLLKRYGAPILAVVRAGAA